VWPEVAEERAQASIVQKQDTKTKLRRKTEGGRTLSREGEIRL
jgi:hypothetical protein